MDVVTVRDQTEPDRTVEPNSYTVGPKNSNISSVPSGSYWRSGVAESARRFSKKDGLFRMNDSAPSVWASSAIRSVGMGPFLVCSFCLAVA